MFRGVGLKKLRKRLLEHFRNRWGLNPDEKKWHWPGLRRFFGKQALKQGTKRIEDQLILPAKLLRQEKTRERHAKLIDKLAKKIKKKRKTKFRSVADLSRCSGVSCSTLRRLLASDEFGPETLAAKKGMMATGAALRARMIEFKPILPSFRARGLSVRQMHSELSSLLPVFRNMSFSSFCRRMIRFYRRVILG